VRTSREPHHRPPRDERGARRLRSLRRRVEVPAHQGRDDDRGRQGRRGALLARRDPRPEGLVLLNYLMDPHGPRALPRVPHLDYQLMMELIDACLTMTVEEILQLPDVKERPRPLHEAPRGGAGQLLCCSRCTATSSCSTSRAGGHPPDEPLHDLCAVSQVQHLDPRDVGLKKQNVVLATGKSILDRGSKTNVGDLMLTYGGGGHDAAAPVSRTPTRPRAFSRS